MNTTSEKKSPGGEHTLLSLLCNIILPVVVLRQLTARWGAGPALLFALAFPLAYGAWDLMKRRKANPFSILGLVNVLITGSLAWAGVTGFWFAVKEAAFPFLIGLFILISSWTKKPAMELLFLNDNLFQVDLLKQRLRERGTEAGFAGTMRRATRWLAVSFFLSAVTNFFLASRIFVPAEEGLDVAARSVLVNHQLARMTQWSLGVILVPSIIFMTVILYFMIRRVREYTGLTDDEFMRAK